MLEWSASRDEERGKKSVSRSRRWVRVWKRSLFDILADIKDKSR